MAPYSSSKYRLSAGRASRKGPKVALKGPNSEASEGPPLKKRRYIPGGPGGGGRYVEIDVDEPPKIKRTPIRRTSSSRSRPAPEPAPDTVQLQNLRNGR
ncbi:hypothetical protein CNMCM8686_006286 [Aspergillus fumigatus]|nr:hypothetical protein CNMCM8686_006286 [Aspergillus fumigatus]